MKAGKGGDYKTLLSSPEKNRIFYIKRSTKQQEIIIIKKTHLKEQKVMKIKIKKKQEK